MVLGVGENPCPALPPFSVPKYPGGEFGKAKEGAAPPFAHQPPCPRQSARAGLVSGKAAGAAAPIPAIAAAVLRWR